MSSACDCELPSDAESDAETGPPRPLDSNVQPGPDVGCAQPISCDVNMSVENTAMICFIVTPPLLQHHPTHAILRAEALSFLV